MGFLLAPLRARPRVALLAASAVFFVVVVYAFQAYKVGFEPGHPGWVSSAHLAMIQRAGAEHFFVGNVGEYVSGNGELRYVYFNRAPFFSEALMHGLLSPWQDDLARYAHYAAQLQNGVYLLTLAVVFLLARLWLASSAKAAIVAFWVGSGYYLTHYKDLVEQNRLGALAMVLAVYAIARYERYGKRRPLLVLTALASVMGEASPGSFVFLGWFLVAGAANLPRWRELRVRPLIGWVPLQCLLLSGALSFSVLAYNIVVEAHITQTPIGETSIVGSATKRLGGLGERQEKLGFDTYLPVQLQRAVRGALPYDLSKGLEVERYDAVLFLCGAAFALALLVAALTLSRAREQEGSGGRRLSVLVAVVGPLLYLLAVKRLVAFHDFTMTYLVLWWMLVASLPLSRLREQFALPVALLACESAAHSIWDLGRDQERIAQNVNWMTAEFQAIRDALGDERARVLIPGDARDLRRLVPGAPYAQYFYLHGHTLTLHDKRWDFVLARGAERGRLRNYREVVSGRRYALFEKAEGRKRHKRDKRRKKRR